ncbi:MAG: hypothetical protein RLZZ584_3206 [Pseudomonadota bacterium]
MAIKSALCALLSWGLMNLPCPVLTYGASFAIGCHAAQQYSVNVALGTEQVDSHYAHLESTVEGPEFVPPALRELQGSFVHLNAGMTFVLVPLQKKAVKAFLSTWAATGVVQWGQASNIAALAGFATGVAIHARGQCPVWVDKAWSFAEVRHVHH